MNRLLKTINKFNGNICFAGSTDYGDVVFECDRQNQVLTYEFSSKQISDVCQYDGNTYAIAFSNDYIGKYSSGALDESAIGPLAINNIGKILRNSSGSFYILDVHTNELSKYDGVIRWTIILPDYSLRNNGNICLRESDGVIVYYNNENIYLIRDDLNQAIIINKLIISDTPNNMRVAIGGEFSPAYTYARARTVSPPEILQSSSSSSLSSSSLSSLSSSSYSSESSSSPSSESSSTSSSSSSTEARTSSSSSSSSSSYINYWSSSSISSSSSSSSSQICDLYLFCVSGIGTQADGTYVQLGWYNNMPFWRRISGGDGSVSYIWRYYDMAYYWAQSGNLGYTWSYHDDGTQQCPASGTWDVNGGGTVAVTITNGYCDDCFILTPRDSIRDWVSVASSSDGANLVAANQGYGLGGGYIYISNNYGVSWTQQASAHSWNSVASSSDGANLVAGAASDYIYTSNNYGVSWTARKTDMTRFWNSVASSSDGANLVASAYNNYIYTSNNYGIDWTSRDNVRNWISVASSSDGANLVAGVIGDYIYTSNDYGVSWTAQITDSTRAWYSVASSSDGANLVAVASSDYIYTSNNYGISWTPRDSIRNWRSVASSSDGSELVAGDFIGGKIYNSTNYGVTWTPRSNDGDWYSIASSSDGSKLLAANYNGYIYTIDMNCT